MQNRPGLVVRSVSRMGVGRANQVYFKSLPPGGISVSEEALERAKVVSESQQRDERSNFSKRNRQQSLGLAIHNFAHELAQEFLGRVAVPNEYKRELIELCKFKTYM